MNLEVGDLVEYKYRQYPHNMVLLIDVTKNDSGTLTIKYVSFTEDKSFTTKIRISHINKKADNNIFKYLYF